MYKKKKKERKKTAGKSGSAFRRVQFSPGRLNRESENHVPFFFFFFPPLEKDTHPSDYFAPFVHADVVLALFSLYSDVAPKRFRLDDEESCKQEERQKDVSGVSGGGQTWSRCVQRSPLVAFTGGRLLFRASHSFTGVTVNFYLPHQARLNTFPFRLERQNKTYILQTTIAALQINISRPVDKRGRD